LADPDSDQRRVKQVAAAVAVAAVIQLPLTYLGGVFPMANDLYGAPLPVGESSGMSFFGGSPTFFLPFWLVNVAVTAAVIYLILRAGAPHSALWASIWALLSVLVSYLMQLGVAARVLPFAGLPVPAAIAGFADGRPLHLVVLVDAALSAAVFVWWRHRRLARL
jgi:hypothetical protein